MEMRLFLALEIPGDIKEKLAKVQEKLRPLLPGVRWEEVQKLHLTLVFLGDVPEERVGELEEVVRRGVKDVEGIRVELAEVGFFPKTRPRVVLLEIGEGREEVERLQRRLARELSAAGFAFARLSKPHVTLGRFKKDLKGLKGVKWGKDLGSFAVSAIAIVESKLHPSGAIHIPRTRVLLERRV